MEVKVLMPYLVYLELSVILMGELGIVESWGAELRTDRACASGCGVCVCVCVMGAPCQTDSALSFLRCCVLLAGLKFLGSCLRHWHS